MPYLTDDEYRCRILAQLEERILKQAENRYEHFELLTLDGLVLLAKDGNRSGVDLTRGEIERWRGQAYLATHNHPASLSFSVGDVLAAIALGVQEVNAFDRAQRYRMRRREGAHWPKPEGIHGALSEIEPQIQAVLQPRLEAGVLAREEALALHRHVRWTLFARRFAASVDYGVEDRK